MDCSINTQLRIPITITTRYRQDRCLPSTSGDIRIVLHLEKGGVTQMMTARISATTYHIYDSRFSTLKHYPLNSGQNEICEFGVKYPPSVVVFESLQTHGRFRSMHQRGRRACQGQLEKLRGLVHLAVSVIQSAMTFTFVCGFGEESPLYYSECFRHSVLYPCQSITG